MISIKSSLLSIIFCFVLFSPCQANDDTYKSFNESYGLLHNLSGTKIFPWVATIHTKNGIEDHMPAIILNPSLLVMNDNHYLKGELVFQKFSTYSVTVNFTQPGDKNKENPYKQTVDITHVRLHPNLAFVHLKTPLRFDDQVHAVCLPSKERVEEILSLSSNTSGIVLLSDWKHYHETISHRLIVMTNSEEDKHSAHTTCVHRDTDDIGSVALGRVSKFSEEYYFLGFVNNVIYDNPNCNPESIIYVLKPTELNIDIIQDHIRCGPKNFTCDDGQCVSLEAICNNITNCTDGSNENVVYCEAVLNRNTNLSHYQCQMNGSLISTLQKCDGKDDCPGGDDESNCTTGLPASIIAGISIGVFIFFIVIGVSAYLWRKLKFALGETGDLTDEQVADFHNGLKANILNNSNGNENIMSCPSFLSFPSTSNFEIPREKLKIEWQKVLGKGRFSIVYKGVYDCGDSCYDVAVKTFKTPCGPCGCKSAFMSQLTELKIMSQIGPHDNIVNLVGAYTKEIKKRILYIVVELCQLGNLHAYLTQNRERFVDVIDRDGTFNPFKSQRLRRNVGTQYENIVQVAHPEKSFTTLDLLLWAYQIASAMDYLAANKISHGDLAARNILLTDNYNAKISDFGLSSELFKTGPYKNQRKKTLLPFRWMAIESIQDNNFSSNSDIWSYGVTIWEIFSLGKLPYSELSQENICDELVQKGTRLEEPDFASTEIYAKMMECWNVQADERPSFSSLKTCFHGMYQCLDYVIIPYL